MNIKTKIVAALTIAAFVLPGISFAQTTTPTIASIQAEIQSLLVELQTLEFQAKAGGGSTSTISGGGSGPAPVSPTSTVVAGGSGFGSSDCYIFSSNLGIGSTGTGVQDLQSALNAKGLPVSVNGNYDQQTANAVTNFQDEYASQILTPNGLQTGTGYVGKSTRQVLNSLFGCGSGHSGPTPTTTPISPIPCIIAPGSNISCPITNPMPVPVTSTLPMPIMCPGGGIPNSADQCPPLPTGGPVPIPTSTSPCVIPPGSNITCAINPTPSPTAPAPVVTSVNPPGYGLSQFSYGSVTITISGSGFAPNGNAVSLEESSGVIYKIYNVPSFDGKTLVASTANMVEIQSQTTATSAIGSVAKGFPTDPGTYELSVTNSNGTSATVPVVISQ